MLRPKSCPRCKTGDVGVDRDHHGWYEYCIQCGYMRDLVGVIEAKAKQSSHARGRRREPRMSDKGK